MTFQELREKMSTDFYLLILLRQKSVFRSMRAGNGERIGIKPLTCAAGLTRFVPAAALPSFWQPAW